MSFFKGNIKGKTYTQEDVHFVFFILEIINQRTCDRRSFFDESQKVHQIELMG